MIATAIIILFTLGIAAMPMLYELRTGIRINIAGKVFLALCFGLAITTFWKEVNLWDQKNKNKSEMNIYQQELKNISLQLKQKNDSIRIVMYQNTDTLKKRIEYLRNDNEFLSKQLSKSSLETMKNVTGEGYCTFEIWGSNDLKFAYAGALQSRSAYPIYDVSYLIYDYDSVFKCPSFKKGQRTYVDLGCFELHSKSGRLATLPKNVYSYVDYSFASKEKYKAMEIKIHTRNANYFQLAIYELKRGFCKKSYKLYGTNSTGLIQLEFVNDLNLTAEQWDKTFFPTDKVMVYTK